MEGKSEKGYQKQRKETMRMEMLACGPYNSHAGARTF